uniref:Uncharacterized protein n=1 Tax=Amphimedon queenslandica TaxID=400682 RepID=A0A1X7V0X7_AMPQE
MTFPRPSNIETRGGLLIGIPSIPVDGRDMIRS